MQLKAASNVQCIFISPSLNGFFEYLPLDFICLRRLTDRIFFVKTRNTKCCCFLGRIRCQTGNLVISFTMTARRRKEDRPPMKKPFPRCAQASMPSFAIGRLAESSARPKVRGIGEIQSRKAHPGKRSKSTPANARCQRVVFVRVADSILECFRCPATRRSGRSAR